MDAYFLGHLGLGDNLYCIGAARYLTKFYRNVYFLCKDKYEENVKSFFDDNERIICVPIHSSNKDSVYELSLPVTSENDAIRNVLNNKYEDNDIFICGFAFTPHFPSKITNQSFLQREKITRTYSLKLDTIDDDRYSFIIDMYNDADLTTGVMIDYWNLPKTEDSKKLYESVKDYNIIFIQSISSNNKVLRVNNIVKKYLYDDNTILLFNDYNIYDNANINLKQIKIKRELAEKFVKNKFIYYIDTIKNAKEIYMIDSCFTGIVLPLYKKGLLKANPVRLVMRRLIDDYDF